MIGNLCTTYIEGQRIVSKLVSGLNNKGKGPLKAGSDRVNYSKKQQDSREGIVKNLKWLGQDGQLLTAGNSGKTPPGQLKKIKGSDGGGKDKGGKDRNAEKFQYYYHPDHLGSTSYITDASGEVYQHLEYFAFGETFVEEHSNTHRTPYKFNGKELDEETGLYYYGARYYDARTSVWLAVDPATDKMPGWSPYNYTFNNPVQFTDPDGKIPWPVAAKFMGAARNVVSGFFRNRTGSKHGAVDIAHMSISGQTAGGAVQATHGGVVTVSQKNNKSAGNWVVITNGDLRTRYLHMKDAPMVKQGDKVKEGDALGFVGSTGRSEAPHLHYEIQRKNEDGKWTKINPVVGDPDKVQAGDNVDLKDPQKIINKRDGVEPSFKDNWKSMIQSFKKLSQAIKAVKNENSQ